MVETRIKRTYILIVDQASRDAAQVNIARSIELNVEAIAFYARGRPSDRLTNVKRDDGTLVYTRTTEG